MRPGDVLDDRFEIRRFAASGGMGEVFQARDRLTGKLVAIKVRTAATAQQKARFEREVHVLAELQHPAIVQYIARGATPSGDTYLAMEWLVGEDLQARLRRERMALGDSVALVTRVADALGFAHGRGVVHRDIKPSNLFLVKGDPRQVKVLDFGLAQLEGMMRMTQKGARIGTPSYMAPEQARAETVLTPSVDVFALGCVLFECLTGIAAFRGEHAMAVFAKILFVESPRVRDLCPQLPANLDDLVTRMLAKAPAGRPADGAAVASEIGSLGEALAAIETVPSLQPLGVHAASLTVAEKRLLSVVLIAAPRSDPGSVSAASMIPVAPALRAAVAAVGGESELLLDGTIVVTISGTGIATDQAVRAARCALSLRMPAAGRPIALSTGRGELTSKLPVSDAIDRAAEMLMQPSIRATSAPSGDPQPIAIDHVTAGLLDGTFDVRENDSGLLLYGERDDADPIRTVLGKPVPCVGRDRELSDLQALFDECMEEPMACAVLVTAPAGMGKSRLAHEFLRMVRRRVGPVEVWVARAESMGGGSAFGLLRQVIRHACGIADGESLATRQEKLCARVGRRVKPRDQKRISEFFGELAGIPFPEDDSAPLRSARRDAQLMGVQIGEAWQDFLRAECQAQPVVLVLEDLHWGDRPTVRLIDAALRDLAGHPFMVLALARPEVNEAFPKLWTARNLHEIRLTALTRKASERLVRLVLGERAGNDVIERLVHQAGGHAFYLEELIRAVADAKDAALPATVVAMVQARLEGFASEARRVLRAASIFGETFWRDGVAALLGGMLQSTDTADWLAWLVEREVLVRHSESRFQGQEELSFRQLLLRAGAYAMLTEEDRVLGHRLAAEWLEGHGENDPVVLAEHFERGHRPIPAGSYYFRAAYLAHMGNDSAAAEAYAERGLACDVPEPMRIELLALLGNSHGWRGEHDIASGYFDEVLRLATPGSMSWATSMAHKQGIALQKRNMFEFMSTLQQLQNVDPAPEAVSIFAVALVYGIFLLFSIGREDLSKPVVQRLHTIVEPVADRDPIARGWMYMSNTRTDAWMNEQPFQSLMRSEAAMESFREANFKRGILVARLITGMNVWLMGDFERAERDLRETQVAGDDFGPLASLRTRLLAATLNDLSKHDEACAMAAHMIQNGRSPADEGRGRWALAETCLRKGDLDTAEREIKKAIELLQVIPIEQPPANAMLAAIQLARGGADEALSTAQAALQGYERLRIFGFKGAFARLVHAEALYATGQAEKAREALAIARDRLLVIAARIDAPDLRQSFLQRVPENARIQALAREWQCSPAAP